MSKKIGIVGDPTDPHVKKVRSLLRCKNAEVIIIPSEDCSDFTSLSWRNGEIIYKKHNLHRFDAFYIHNVIISMPFVEMKKERRSVKGWYEQYMAELERQSFITSVLKDLEGDRRRIINPISSFDFHFLKTHQLALLRRNGIPVPSTLVTNSPREVIKFVQEHKRVVYKPCAGGAACKELTLKDYKRLDRLAFSPVIFQELIEGDNVRIYMIDGKVIVGAVIESKDIDYRQNVISIKKIEVPREVVRSTKKAMELCSLKFSGIDFRRKPDGTYIILDCNPSPIFLRLEEDLGVSISGAICNYLLK